MQDVFIEMCCLYLFVGYNIKHLQDLRSGLHISLRSAEGTRGGQSVRLKRIVEVVQDIYIFLGKQEETCCITT